MYFIKVLKNDLKLLFKSFFSTLIKYIYLNAFKLFFLTVLVQINIFGCHMIALYEKRSLFTEVIRVLWINHYFKSDF